MWRQVRNEIKGQKYFEKSSSINYLTGIKIDVNRFEQPGPENNDICGFKLQFSSGNFLGLKLLPLSEVRQ